MLHPNIAWLANGYRRGKTNHSDRLNVEDESQLMLIHENSKRISVRLRPSSARSGRSSRPNSWNGSGSNRPTSRASSAQTRRLEASVMNRMYDKLTADEPQENLANRLRPWSAKPPSVLSNPSSPNDSPIPRRRSHSARGRKTSHFRPKSSTSVQSNKSAVDFNETYRLLSSYMENNRSSSPIPDPRYLDRHSRCYDGDHIHEKLMVDRPTKACSTCGEVCFKGPGCTRPRSTTPHVSIIGAMQEESDINPYRPKSALLTHAIIAHQRLEFRKEYLQYLPRYNSVVRGQTPHFCNFVRSKYIHDRNSPTPPPSYPHDAFVHDDDDLESHQTSQSRGTEGRPGSPTYYTDNVTGDLTHGEIDSPEFNDSAFSTVPSDYQKHDDSQKGKDDLRDEQIDNGAEQRNDKDEHVHDADLDDTKEDMTPVNLSKYLDDPPVRSVSSPVTSPKDTPKHSPKGTPKHSLEDISKVSLEETPKVLLENTPKVFAEEPSKVSLEEDTPKQTIDDLSKSEMIDIRIPSPLPDETMTLTPDPKKGDDTPAMWAEPTKSKTPTSTIRSSTPLSEESTSELTPVPPTEPHDKTKKTRSCAKKERVERKLKEPKERIKKKKPEAPEAKVNKYDSQDDAAPIEEPSQMSAMELSTRRRKSDIKVNIAVPDLPTLPSQTNTQEESAQSGGQSPEVTNSLPVDESTNQKEEEKPKKQLGEKPQFDRNAFASDFFRVDANELLDLEMKMRRGGERSMSPEVSTIIEETNNNLKDKKHKVQPWLQGRLALSQQSSRFELPMDMKLLETMSPQDYLREYCVVSSRRSQLYQKIFMKNKDKSGVLLFKDFERALNDVLVNTLDKEQHGVLSDLCDITADTKVDFKLFTGIAAFAERFLYPKFLTEDTADIQDHKKGRIECADFDGLLWKLDGVEVNPAVRTILEGL